MQSPRLASGWTLSCRMLPAPEGRRRFNPSTLTVGCPLRTGMLEPTPQATTLSNVGTPTRDCPHCAEGETEAQLNKVKLAEQVGSTWQPSPCLVHWATLLPPRTLPSGPEHQGSSTASTRSTGPRTFPSMTHWFGHRGLGTCPCMQPLSSPPLCSAGTSLTRCCPHSH